MCKRFMFLMSLVLVFTLSASAGLIVNGSFETPTMAGGAYSHYALSGGNGWPIHVGTHAVENSGGQGWPYSPTDGTNNLWLGSTNHTNMYVAQPIGTIVDGQVYSINVDAFTWNTNTSGYAFLRVGTDATQAVGLLAQTVDFSTLSYRTQYYNLTATWTGTAGYAGQTLYAGAIATANNVVLDDMVPEPATIMLLGLGSLALLRRRR